MLTRIIGEEMIIYKCAHCFDIFTPSRPGHRYCTDKCRAAAHREKTLPGTVTGLRQLKGGGWSVTVHYPQQPAGLNIGARVALDMASGSRQDAYGDDNVARGIPRHEVAE